MAIGACDRLLSHANALASPQRLRIVRLDGELRDSLVPLTAIYAGNGANFDYLQRLFFERIRSQTLIAETHPFRLSSALSLVSAKADILLCERAPLWAYVGPTLGSIRFPAWLRQDLELPDELPMTKRLLPRQVEREADRCIRRHAYTVRFSRDENDIAAFYREQYVPYVTSRFASGGVVVPWTTFAATARHLTLAQLWSANRWVAGMLFRQRRRTLRLHWFGADTSPPPPGASQALDVMCIRQAWLNGVRTVVFGNSRPSLTDGIVRYKRKFGARLATTRYPQAMLEIGILRPSPDLATTLRQHQLIVSAGAGFDLDLTALP